MSMSGGERERQGVVAGASSSGTEGPGLVRVAVPRMTWRRSDADEPGAQQQDIHFFLSIHDDDDGNHTMWSSCAFACCSVKLCYG
jgi:hypothetical protein